MRFPTIEVYISNPARRGTQSDVATASRGTVTGFGIVGYELAMRGLMEMLVPLHSDFDRLTVPWFQCGQVGAIDQDSDTPRHPRAP